MQLGPTEPNNNSNSTPQSESDSASNAMTDSGTQQPSDPVAIQSLYERFTANDDLLANTLLFAGVILMVVIMMRMLVKKSKKNSLRQHYQGSPSQRIAHIHETAQSSMTPPNKLMVEAEEMARHIGAILDNKAARLELLIEEADRKLDTLNRALSPTSVPHPSEPTPNAQQSSPPAQPARTIDPSLLDRARMDQDQAERQSRVVGRIEPTFQESAPAPPATEPKSVQSQVIELAAAGHTNIEIAHQLKQPIGQVELILNLRKQQG